jgi:hypothetical protein
MLTISQRMMLVNSHILRFLVGLCVFCIGMSGVVNATAFVVIPAQSRFFIGSDSKRAIHGPDEGTLHVCKVHSSRNQVMLIWGHMGFALPKGNGREAAPSETFDSVAAAVLSSDRGIEPKRDLLKQKAEEFLKKQMAEMDRAHATPLTYDYMVLGGAFVSDAISDYGIYAFSIKVVDWKTRQFGHGDQDWSSTNLIQGTPIPFGKTNAYSQYESSHPRFPANPTKQEAVKTIEDILNLQAQITPGDVGLPLSIALLKIDGLEWIEGGACGASPKQEKPKKPKKTK